jgi:hypothetical protein
MTSALSSTHLEKSVGSPALKLPPLFSLTPSSTGKGTQTQKRNVLTRQPSQEVTSDEKSLAVPPTKDQLNGSAQGIFVLILQLSYQFQIYVHCLFFLEHAGELGIIILRRNSLSFFYW